MKEYLYDPPSPADQRASASVIRVTPSAVERHVIDFGADTPSTTGFLTPFDDGFYAMCSGGVLCKWDVNGVKLATEEEQRRHDGTNRLFRGDINNQTINGWSVRQVRRSSGDHFEVEVDKRFTLSVENHTMEEMGYPDISVDLLRPGQARETLWHVDGHPRRVSEAEYERYFMKP